MTHNFNEVILHPPPEVTINQWKDGSIHFRCGVNGYLPLGQLLAQLAVQCNVYAEAYKTATREATTAQSQPVAVGAQEHIAQMELEIARLRGAGIPVSVNTNPTMSAAQQLAAIVAPTVMEVAAAMASRNVQHPAAAMAAVAVHSPVIPRANVPPQPAIPPHVPAVSTAHQNPGPMQLGSVPNGVVIRPILRQTSAGTPAPEAPLTIVSGGVEVDDGELGPPPTPWK